MGPEAEAGKRAETVSSLTCCHPLTPCCLTKYSRGTFPAWILGCHLQSGRRRTVARGGSSSVQAHPRAQPTGWLPAEQPDKQLLRPDAPILNKSAAEAASHGELAAGKCRSVVEGWVLYYVIGGPRGQYRWSTALCKRDVQPSATMISVICSCSSRTDIHLYKQCCLG